jgi:alpha/beta superfamily hydrolase
MGLARAETITFDAGGRRLEARWRPGTAGGAVIAPPHPEYGGRLDHPVVEALAEALAAAHMATLAFNWAGVGGSEGQVSGDLESADGDYAAALVELARRGGERPIVAAGYSFGAATALRLAGRVDRLLLVAPPVALLGAEELRACPRPTAVLVGDADDYAPGDLVAALMPRRDDARLEILSGIDHYFGGADALERLRQGLGAALA